jgi:hypothetical protein
MMTSQKASKSLSASGCGPLMVTSLPRNSPVSRSNVSANVMIPASRSRTLPRPVWIFSGRPLYVVMNVMVPASSSMTGAGPEVVPALEILTDLPFSAVNVSLNEPALLKLSSEYSVNVFWTTITLVPSMPHRLFSKVSLNVDRPLDDQPGMQSSHWSLLYPRRR